MKIGVLLTLAFLLNSAASAQVTCADVKYGSSNYHENMETLVRLVGVRDGFNRYHETVVSEICARKTAVVADFVDKGFVSAKQVADLRRILTPAPQGRSEAGKTYGFSRQKFEHMGLCSACADNVAQHYTNNPGSACGKLAKRSLEGDPEAVRALQAFPSYCKWNY